MKNKIKNVFLNRENIKFDIWYCSIGIALIVIPLFLFLISDSMGIMGAERYSLDKRVLDDSVYLSIWVSMLGLIYFIVKLFKTLKIKQNVVFEHLDMVVAVISLLTGFVFICSAIVGDVATFPTVPAWIRSACEHIIIPFYILGYLIIRPVNIFKKTSPKQIMIGILYISIFLGAYFFWITWRYALISYYPTDKTGNSYQVAIDFPYLNNVLAPLKIGWGLYTVAVLGVMSIYNFTYLGAIKLNDFLNHKYNYRKKVL